MMQYVICLETKNKFCSDCIYINAFIKNRYCLAYPTPKFTYVFLNGKTNFDRKEREIRCDEKKYSGESIVIMCFDTDQNCQTLNDRINDYCLSRGYLLVWMNRDIEEVFLGHRLSSCSEKKAEAERYARSHEILHLNDKLVNCKLPLSKNGTSNLAVVFDTKLIKKNGLLI